MVLFLGISSAQASESDDFDVSISDLYEISNILVVSYDVEFLSEDVDFSFWKIRVSCEDGMKAFIEGSSENICGSSTFDHDVTKKGGYIIFVNDNDSTVRTTAKFRAFDSDGKWLSSESSSVAF